MIAESTIHTRARAFSAVPRLQGGRRLFRSLTRAVGEPDEDDGDVVAHDSAPSGVRKKPPTPAMLGSDTRDDSVIGAGFPRGSPHQIRSDGLR